TASQCRPGAAMGALQEIHQLSRHPCRCARPWVRGYLPAAADPAAFFGGRKRNSERPDRSRPGRRTNPDGGDEMSEDEKAIRQVVKTWMEATQRGDTATVLDLMTDDVVFMVPGAEPFGTEEFAAAAESMGGMKIDGTNEI